VQSLKISLFPALECRKPHRWSRGCLSDRLRIDDVALVRLHVRLHKLAGIKRTLCPKPVSSLQSPENPRTIPSLQPPALLARKTVQRVSPEACLLDWHAIASEADDVEDVFADISAVDSSRARHIALWHSNLLRFGSLYCGRRTRRTIPSMVRPAAKREAFTHHGNLRFG
jgi:hypothetical protein